MVENDDLTVEQQLMLVDFGEISQITDVNLCRSILEQNNWNLEAAVQNFVNNSDNTTSAPPPRHTNNNITSNNNNNNSRSSLTDLILTPLKWIFQSHPESMNPEQDSRKFVLEMSEKYGNNGPQFSDLSYSQTVARAFRNSKILMVYLHSPLHDDTERFCRYIISFSLSEISV
jgi:hypothetical protein